MIDYSTKRKNKLKNEVKAYTLLGLPMGWWTLFFVVAFFSALFFSFTNVSLKKLATGAEIKFTLDNYKRIFCPDFAKFDKTFWDSMGVTVVWTLVMTLGNNLMGLVCAFLINSLKKRQTVFPCAAVLAQSCRRRCRVGRNQNGVRFGQQQPCQQNSNAVWRTARAVAHRRTTGVVFPYDNAVFPGFLHKNAYLLLVHHFHTGNLQRGCHAGHVR